MQLVQRGPVPAFSSKSQCQLMSGVPVVQDVSMRATMPLREIIFEASWTLALFALELSPSLSPYMVLIGFVLLLHTV